MKTRAWVLATATMLALSSLFGLAGSAAASVPPPDEHPTAAVQRGTPPHDGGLRCGSGHGAQFDCRDTGAPAAGGQAVDAAPAPARAAWPALTLIGLVPLLAAALFTLYLRRQHRPREAI
ncbi:MAG TPA: hypothetical protein VGM21_05985 [Actinomycetota bacterium]|jgi:hypothetical protein